MLLTMLGMANFKIERLRESLGIGSDFGGAKVQ